MDESDKVTVRNSNTPQAAHAAHAAHTAHFQPADGVINKGRFGVKRPNNKYLLWVVVAILLLAALGTAGYFYNRYHNSQKEVTKLKSNPQIVAQTEAQQLIDKVGRLTDLPKGETPTIATVTDITKLKGQAFFANAQNGDRVLIYTQAKKAILYRPSTDKVINIAPVNIGSNAQSSTQTTPTAQTPTGTTGR